MHWNHRLVHSVPDDLWGVAEVFYESEGDLNDDNTVDGFAFVEVVGDSPADVRQTLDRMLAALDRPALRWSIDGGFVVVDDA